MGTLACKDRAESDFRPVSFARLMQVKAATLHRVISNERYKESPSGEPQMVHFPSEPLYADVLRLGLKAV